MIVFPAAIPQAELVAMVQQPPPPPPSNDNGGQGEDFGKSSPLGFLVLILFMVAVVFLARSMTKHLKRVPASFDEPTTEESVESSESSESAGPSGSKESVDAEAKPAAEGEKKSED